MCWNTILHSALKIGCIVFKRSICLFIPLANCICWEFWRTSHKCLLRAWCNIQLSVWPVVEDSEAVALRLLLARDLFFHHLGLLILFSNFLSLYLNSYPLCCPVVPFYLTVFSKYSRFLLHLTWSCLHRDLSCHWRKQTRWASFITLFLLSLLIRKKSMIIRDISCDVIWNVLLQELKLEGEMGNNEDVPNIVPSRYGRLVPEQ